MNTSEILAGELEDIRTPVPGPRSRELTPTLRSFESRNVTFVDRDFPIFWESASGANVTDVDGNRYIDLTGAFGVANAGHSNPYVAAAIHDQAVRLMHGMGDVHPTEVKVQLLETLARITPGGLGKTFLASTGAEAVEAALKTAMLATGKFGFAAYRGAYHGLSLGTLAVSGIEKFREPFSKFVPQQTLFLDYPRANPLAADEGAAPALDDVKRALSARGDIAALIIEPLQGRGGCIVPPKGYLKGLREICDSLGMLLIFDEIYTGFGRTGTLFACEHEDVVPDILCIGKAMANGFPISATIARPTIMDVWPESPGEALHTSTYLGNPMACAAALANLGEIERMQLPQRARQLGIMLGARLDALRADGKALEVRGRGLMWGIEFADAAAAERIVKDALKAGVILLQAGPQGNVISITPPLVISQRQLFRAMDVITACIK
ncbi:MAG TPA: aspartate aminotransferase family protein [Candidatus Baltobacteraceae bacterium]|nr:aspartate aminotransferase family protein [Candidatus Baltobacteraceae bacterium]